MKNRERILKTLQASRYENDVHANISNLNAIDPAGELELELRLENIGMEGEEIERFKAMYFDDQIAVIKALIQRESERKKAFKSSVDNADLIRRLNALLSFICPTLETQ